MIVDKIHIKHTRTHASSLNKSTVKMSTILQFNQLNKSSPACVRPKTKSNFSDMYLLVFLHFLQNIDSFSCFCVKSSCLAQVNCLIVAFLITFLESTLSLTQNWRIRDYGNVGWMARSHRGHIPKTCSSTSHCVWDQNWHTAILTVEIILEMNASTLGWPVMTVSYVSSTIYDNTNIHCTAQVLLTTADNGL